MKNILIILLLLFVSGCGEEFENASRIAALKSLEEERALKGVGWKIDSFSSMKAIKLQLTKMDPQQVLHAKFSADRNYYYLLWPTCDSGVIVCDGR